ncbi:MAG TPA: hypothetical protein VE944_09170 [Nostoc sp.]|uniref:hypothetical protein n=1 Tax=Nostoc sp. TaxID=1180 RepID=UPI002D5D3156|nr:hypothetical protein [Nostoc sp.]HYX14524.1 hypothetical protein [Nostoc sp.]
MTEMIFERSLFFVGVDGWLKRAIAIALQLKLGILSKAQVFAVQNRSDYLPDITLLK